MAPLRDTTGVLAPTDRDALELRLVDLLTSPRSGIGVTVKCKVDALLYSARRATTATIVAIGSGTVELDAAPGWVAATSVELEIRPPGEATISVHGVIAAADGTTVHIELLPVQDSLAGKRLQRFVLEGIRRRVVDAE